MTTVADIHGTLFTRFGQYDSDFADGYKKGDVIYNGANIYVATSDIAPTTNFRQADSEGDSEAWLLSLETAGTIEQLKDVSFLDSELGTTNILDSDDVLTWDGKRAKWVPASIPRTLQSLTDVHPSVAGSITQTDAHQEAIIWDSDLQLWTTAAVAFSSYSSKMFVDHFVTVFGQTRFNLSETPNGDYTFVRNGMVIRPEALTIDSDSDSSVIYDPAINEQLIMKDSDDVFVYYVANDKALQVAGFNQLDDGKVLDPKPGDILVYDSDVLAFKNVQYFEDVQIATQGQTNFQVVPKALQINGFYRNGLRVRPEGWADSDGSVRYIQTGNYNSPIDSDDTIQITYYR